MSDIRLTVKQATRLQNLIASGPFEARPIDEELKRLGWAQQYDDTDAIEAVEDAAARLYDKHRCIKRELLPLEWVVPISESIRRWMQSVLANDEASSDDELRALFAEQRVSDEFIEAAIARRGDFLNNLNARPL